jgi:hypothetical protein
MESDMVKNSRFQPNLSLGQGFRKKTYSHSKLFQIHHLYVTQQGHIDRVCGHVCLEGLNFNKLRGRKKTIGWPFQTRAPD